MKLFVLLSRFPYPLEKGDKLRAYYQLKELSKNHEIHLACLTDQEILDEWRQEIESFCTSVNIYKLKKPLIYWNTAKQLFSNKPYQVGYFYQAGIERKINTLVKELKPDHIYCQLVRTAEYVKNIHDIPKTIDYQDALSAGMNRRAQISKGISKRMFFAEGKRLAEYENRIFDYFNHHTIISEQDRSLIGHPSNSEIQVIENGIASDYFEYDKKYLPKYDLVFTGNMSYAPNIECAEFLVWDVLRKLDKDVTLVLSGTDPHPRIKDLAKENKVIVTGWVDDIRDAYASAKIFVAPLFIGTGLQNKLLEAMAMGIPAVTTTLANNALHAVSGEHIMVADSAEEFVTTINRLLADEILREKISANGKTFVQANFSWEHSVRKLENLLLGRFQKQ